MHLRYVERPDKAPDSRHSATTSVDLAMPMPGSSSRPVDLVRPGEPGICRYSKTLHLGGGTEKRYKMF
ncbi:hypothetical protein MtT11555_08755 [Mycobacterium tuberculosis]|nr:hypothetical protein B0W97_17205 [Mycobacterium tuberculosis]OPF83324.1 hypothetical protein BXP25_06380 [Mycobacterium tuberculosis variant bovis]ORT91645.1 hypothetical protein BS299_02310 [Mycobacterium tuberculosis M13]AWY78632.1 hypothetical protein B0W95_20335 [Mycobacterium tuberculosis]AWY82058.1 hypothetical protein B0W96_16060 [Mycobacterium tuberculosis]